MQPSWWSEYDEPILEILHESGKALPPRVIHFNLEYENRASPHRSTVKRRLNRLCDHGLTEKVDDSGYYIITDTGERFLEGELDAESIEKD
ncbi:winged-helix domain-containing protein [Halopiger goleimassiliensis]|uniref:winged-helix domain-containing protein n=1 Tax=Halopiger goleimassiliensis TaxID=1293048 RepID=UPI0009DC0758|nr:winged-helix domain-containing protein [Halopiger goleimassiliensis]